MSNDVAVRAVMAQPESTFGFSAADSPTMADIEVVLESPDRWRIADVRLPHRDPFRLLAFVQRHGDVLAPVQCGALLYWSEFKSLAAAIDFVIASSPRTARERFSHGPLNRRALSPSMRTGA